ncbi:MAG TPA: tetratricopeptide repeat protein [Polyangia bacterium]|jgi:tetratricopeptide (TPR) repeat protein
MKRPGSIFGVGLTLVFVMFSAGPVSHPASAAFPTVDPTKAPTEAPTAAQKAKQHYLQGEAYFKSRNFSDAMDEYQRGYLEKPDPVFIFNMAQCQRLLGHRAAAVEYYQRYLREAPEGPGRGVAEKQIADLQRTAPADGLAAPAYGAPPPVEAAPSPPVIPLHPVAPEFSAPAPVVEAPAAVPDSAPSSASATSIINTPAPMPPMAAAPVYVAASAEPAPLPVYKRWWFWAGAGALFMGALLVAAEASSGRPGCDPGRICK